MNDNPNHIILPNDDESNGDNLFEGSTLPPNRRDALERLIAELKPDYRQKIKQRIKRSINPDRFFILVVTAATLLNEQDVADNKVGEWGDAG